MLGPWKKNVSTHSLIGLGLAISRKLCKMMNGDMVRAEGVHFYQDRTKLQLHVCIVDRIRRRKRLHFLFQN